MSQKDCIFCQIIKGEVEASFIHQDELCSAFLTIEPINPGHTLIIPNQHAKNLAEMPEQTAAHMIKVAKKISIALKESNISCDGINIMMCDGEEAGQSVFHTHMHVTPRNKADGFSWSYPPAFGMPIRRSELDRIAAKLTSKYEE